METGIIVQMELLPGLEIRVVVLSVDVIHQFNTGAQSARIDYARCQSRLKSPMIGADIDRVIFIILPRWGNNIEPGNAVKNLRMPAKYKWREVDISDTGPGLIKFHEQRDILETHIHTDQGNNHVPGQIVPQGRLIKSLLFVPVLYPGDKFG